MADCLRRRQEALTPAAIALSRLDLSLTLNCARHSGVPPRSRRRTCAISCIEKPRTSILPSSVSSASDQCPTCTRVRAIGEELAHSSHPLLADLSLGWRRRGQRLGWRLLHVRRLHTSALTFCDLRVERPQLVTSGLGRLTKLGFLPPIEAPLSAFRAGAGLNSLRENHRKPRNYRPHACRSPAVLMAASSVNTSNPGVAPRRRECRRGRLSLLSHPQASVAPHRSAARASEPIRCECRADRGSGWLCRRDVGCSIRFP